MKYFLIPAFVLVVLIALLFYNFNPADYDFFPKCILYQFTGLQCPLCGGQRAIHHLLQGSLLESLRQNMLLIPFALLAVISLLQTFKIYVLSLERTAFFWKIFILIAVVYGIVRNLV